MAGLSVDDLVIDSTPDQIREDGEPKAARRGRPPGVKNGEGRARRTPVENRTVSEALSTMQSAYDLLGLLLMPIAPNAARIFRDGVESAQKSNQRAFEASPKLAKRVASTGEKGGAAGFIIGNVVLIAPVVAAASAEISLKLPSQPKRQPKPARQPTQQPQQPAQRQDIPRPNIPAAEGFTPPSIPIWDATKGAYV